MTDRVETVTAFRVEHRLPSGAQRVLGASPSLGLAQDAATRWYRLLRRLGGTGVVVVVNAVTGGVVASRTIDGRPW